VSPAPGPHDTILDAGIRVGSASAGCLSTGCTVAAMAHDGLALATRPIHTPFDGDTIVALATARRDLAVTPEVLARLVALAAAGGCR
jgi:L-aminopeptidase/D-esterase-like protein